MIAPKLSSPIVTRFYTGDRAYTERVIAREGTLVRVQTENRGGTIFMRAKKRVLYTAPEPA
jgi:hypothetical protein